MAAVPIGQGMNNLTTLIKRLEAATSRLEDIASSAVGVDQQPRSHAGSTSAGAGVAAVGSQPTTMPSQDEPKQATKSVAAPLPPAIEAIDELINEQVKDFVTASSGLDGLIEEQAVAVAKAFEDQRRFLLTSTRARKPDQKSETFMHLLRDLQHDMVAVSNIRENNRDSILKEHLAMVGEGIGVLQWLVMEGKPADFVGEVTGGAQMYGNRVLKAYKERDQKHVKYVQAYYALLRALRAYIMKYYPSGVIWNNNGIDAAKAYEDAGNDSDSSATSAGGAPPPPPPPPPPLPNFDNVPSAPPPPPAASKSGGSDMGAVFEQLNRGDAVTSGLKKVDKSQMTHKNPSLRASSTVPDKTADISRSRSPGPQIKPKPPSMRQNSSTAVASSTATKKASRKELDGNKWMIEHYDSPSSPIELDVSLTQSILISNCKNTTVVVRGKANAISVDHSPRTQLLVENLVSAIDVISSSSVAVQVTGTLPTLLLDQVDGATIYLSKATLSTTEVFTSKCSGINLVLPPEDDADDGDSTEHPVPEQIRTFVKDGKLVSEIVEHAG